MESETSVKLMLVLEEDLCDAVQRPMINEEKDSVTGPLTGRCNRRGSLGSTTINTTQTNGMLHLTLVADPYKHGYTHPWRKVECRITRTEPRPKNH
jgi:hypothetical protein